MARTMRDLGFQDNRIDFISLGVQMGAAIDDLLTYQYCTHPELAAKPSDNSYAFAARDARSKMDFVDDNTVVLEKC